MAAEEKELLPCPFCSGCATLRGEDRGGFFVSCNQCYCCVGEGYDRSAMPDNMFSSEDQAIEAWNRRPDTMEQNGHIAQQMHGKITPEDVELVKSRMA